MFHLQRLKCFKSKYPYLNVFTEWSVWLAQNDWANRRQSWALCTNSIVYIFRLATYPHNYLLLRFLFLLHQQLPVSVLYKLWWALSCCPLETFWRTAHLSEMSSISIYHSPGLWQSGHCVSFLSCHGNKLLIFIACFFTSNPPTKPYCTWSALLVCLSWQAFHVSTVSCVLGCVWLFWFGF